MIRFAALPHLRGGAAALAAVRSLHLPGRER
jgi:hypothetical protein